MITYFYKLDCLTDLHVGSGDVNFGVIDNMVERDPVMNNHPAINASGIKGALRQFAKDSLAAEESIRAWFGAESEKQKQDRKQSGQEADESASEAEGKTKDGRTIPGQLKFLSARLLYRTMRASKGQCAFYAVTSHSAINVYEKTKALLCGSKVPESIAPNANRICGEGKEATVEVEGIEARRGETPTVLPAAFGNDTVLLKDDDFAAVSLPVVARNCLDNGESKYLWYEEIVPHGSAFWFAVQGEEALLNAFNALVEGKVVQFGGGASIGRGLCHITRIA